MRSALFMLALALGLAGCTPAGPRALLNGKKHLDRGEIAAAVAELKTATSLLATNAQAWNYYGVAQQLSGQPDEAVKAYKQALELDRDLLEAHFNLGCLWLEQNKPADARAELTTLTKLRPNDPAGWLKLGSAQLRLGEYAAAERSFSTVISLKPADAEAYNGIGLAFVQRGKPREAAQYFAAATRSNPQLAAAYLNLANVCQQYLHDNKTALENYHAYLQLTPRPANWEEVNALATGLEQSLLASVPTAPAAKAPPAVAATTPTAPAAAPEAKPQPKPSTPVVATRAPATAKPQTAEPAREPEARPTAARPATTPAKPATTQVVQVAPAAPIVVSMQPVTRTPVSAPPAAAVAAPVATATPEPVLVEEVPEPDKKPGFWHRVFNSDRQASAPNPQTLATKLTPLPPANETPSVPERPAAPPTFPRYDYTSPRKPAPGNRVSASGAFTRAQVFEQGEQWTDALQWYQQAAEFDPGWFEAQYNTGVLAHRLRNYSLALPRYENALAIQPDSADTRFNFALALKAAGYASDAANEFKKILASRPEEVRTHLALANLAAQTLRDTTLARRHYLKVLELAPDNPQASEIRFWLAANPQ